MLSLEQKKFIADVFYQKVGKAIPCMDIEDNGQIQRFRDNSKSDFNLDLRLSVYPFRNILHFVGMDMKDQEGTKFSFYGDEVRELSEEEKAEMSKQREEDRKRREQEEKERQKALRAMKTAFEALPYYDDLNLPSPHPYLKKKGLERSYICRYDSNKNELVWALKGPRGEFRGVQRIKAEKDKTGRDKELQTGTRMKGSFTSLYDTTIPLETEIFAVEGLATGLSVFEATGHRNIVLVCVNSGNLAEAIRSAISYFLSSWRLKITPEEFAKRITIIADNDKSGAGENGARKASRETGCFFSVVPNFGDETITDANDIHVKKGLDVLAKWFLNRRKNI